MVINETCFVKENGVITATWEGVQILSEHTNARLAPSPPHSPQSSPGAAPPRGQVPALSLLWEALTIFLACPTLLQVLLCIPVPSKHTFWNNNNKNPYNTNKPNAKGYVIVN